MDAQQLNLTIAAIANTLSEQLSTDDFEFWSILFTQLGASMEGIAAFRTLKRGGTFPYEQPAVSGEAAYTAHANQKRGGAQT